MISGGKNGSGDWTEYLGQLTDAFKALKKKTGAEPLLYKLDTDICDDVWTGCVFLYDHEDKVQESLNEDLIVIEPNEAKEKLIELQDQIKAEKDEKVRKSLLTLMNIYLFQTYKPSDREGSTITDDEWQEISDWHQNTLKKEIWVQQDDGQLKSVEVEFDPADEETNSNLTEASLDYHTQLAKMQAAEDGTRKFNAKAASIDKLLYNYDICIKHGFARTRKEIEDELDRRGLSGYIKKAKQPADKTIVISPDEVTQNGFKYALSLIRNYTHKTDEFIRLGHPWKWTVLYLLMALVAKETTFATELKDAILAAYDITLQELKDVLSRQLANNLLMRKLELICASLKESLEKDMLYSYRQYGKRITESMLSEGCWWMPYTLADANKLRNLMQNPCPKKWVGDGGTKNDALGIGDDELYDSLSRLKDEEDARPTIQKFIKEVVLPEWDNYSYSQPEGDNEGNK